MKFKFHAGQLVHEFFIRIYDEYCLWRLRRQYARITEQLKHLLLTRKEVEKKIANIEAFYDFTEGK